jgi:hypothetical protein
MSSVREDIARTPVETQKYNNNRYLTLDGVDQILSLVCKRIEGVENPYPKETGVSIYWEEARQAILDAIKEE